MSVSVAACLLDIYRCSVTRHKWVKGKGHLPSPSHGKLVVPFLHRLGGRVLKEEEKEQLTQHCLFTESYYTPPRAHTPIP